MTGLTINDLTLPFRQLADKPAIPADIGSIERRQDAGKVDSSSINQQ
jgi:hypothetical protein